MPRLTFKQRLQSIGACQGALDWVGDRTAKQAWKECPSLLWKEWLVGRVGTRKDKGLMESLYNRVTTWRGLHRLSKKHFPECPRLKWPAK